MNGAQSRKVENQSMEEILNSIRRIIADDRNGSPPPIRKVEPIATPKTDPIPGETAIEEDILALRSALNAIRTEMDGTSANSFSREHRKDDSFANDDALSFDDDFLPPLAPAQQESAVSGFATERLMSPDTEYSVRQSFSDLSATVENAHDDMDVEATARALLRPMLQRWLDKNLPALVERLVREEIVRITERLD